jgi:hypothetical protein
VLPKNNNNKANQNNDSNKRAKHWRKTLVLSISRGAFVCKEE